jgi:outer membrane protein
MNIRFSQWKAGIPAFLLLWTVQARAQQTQQNAELHRFTIQDALDYGKKNSSKVKNAMLDYKIQEQTNRSVTATALPQITGSASLTDYTQIPTTLIPGEFVGQPAGTFVPLQFGTQYNTNAGITLKQILFDGQVMVGLQARQVALDYYGKSQEITEQGLRVNIYKVYYSLLLSKTQMELIDANISKAQELLHSTSELFKNGFSEKLDVDKATVQLSNFESEKIRTKFNIDNGYLGLKVLLGMPIRDSLILTDTLTYEMITNAVMEDNYQYSDRRDFQLLEINRSLNEFDLKRYRKMYIPTASLTANYTQNYFGESLELTKRNSWFPSSYLGLTINVPIFDGFYKDANIQKSKFTLEQTQNNMEALKISIDNDVKQARLRFTASIAELDYEKKNMELAENVYGQTRKKYDQGLGSNTEITSAQSDLTQAQNNYILALYNAIVARIDYRNSIGKL